MGKTCQKYEYLLYSFHTCEFCKLTQFSGRHSVPINLGGVKQNFFVFMAIEKESKKQDFKTLLQNYIINIPKVGDVVKGKVISVDKGEVRIDIEGVTTGIVSGR